MAQLIVDTFGPYPSESGKSEQQRVHLLTGLTIFADWIGSNSDWFPFDFPVDPDSIRNTASETLACLGFNSQVTPDLTFGELFKSNTSPSPITPRAIQSTLIDAADAPGLYIVEAPMGMGKTEAANSEATFSAQSSPVFSRASSKKNPRSDSPSFQLIFNFGNPSTLLSASILPVPESR